MTFRPVIRNKTDFEMQWPLFPYYYDVLYDGWVPDFGSLIFYGYLLACGRAATYDRTVAAAGRVPSVRPNEAGHRAHYRYRTYTEAGSTFRPGPWRLKSSLYDRTLPTSSPREPFSCYCVLVVYSQVKSTSQAKSSIGATRPSL